jgi:hypothetical protein
MDLFVILVIPLVKHVLLELQQIAQPVLPVTSFTWEFVRTVLTQLTLTSEKSMVNVGINAEMEEDLTLLHSQALGDTTPVMMEI